MARVQRRRCKEIIPLPRRRHGRWPEQAERTWAEPVDQIDRPGLPAQLKNNVVRVGPATCPVYSSDGTQSLAFSALSDICIQLLSLRAARRHHAFQVNVFPQMAATCRRSARSICRFARSGTSGKSGSWLTSSCVSSRTC
jgi:hypothetical protein